MEKENLTKAIEMRRSRRKFQGTPIDEKTVAKLDALIVKYSTKDSGRMVLVTNNGKSFNGFTKSYGMFSGINDYIVLIADKNDLEAVEKLGYYGELMVLNTTELGLGSCWVGGGFSRLDMPITLDKGESVICAIVIGHASEDLSFKEKIIHGITHRKTKTVEDMYTSNEPVPEWFIAGMKAVQRAPSAVNRQPVKFTYQAGSVQASVKDVANLNTTLDLGIAKLHFELGAGGGTWIWGNDGNFTKKMYV